MPTPLNDKQVIYQLRERLELSEREAREWRAMAHILAEGKDLLRRELDQLERGDESE
jgi:hypothetical protein